MNPFSLLSSVAGALCVILSAVYYLKSTGVQNLQADLQKQQQKVQGEQQEAQLKQQEAQAQQQAIDDAVKLQQQIGPALLKDLDQLARENKNDKIRSLLDKYGVKFTEGPATDKK